MLSLHLTACHLSQLIPGAGCQVVAYAIQAPAPPFPVLVLFACVNGFGMAIQDAQSNGYVAVMKHNPNRKMGALHAVYGAHQPPSLVHSPVLTSRVRSRCIEWAASTSIVFTRS